MADIIETIGLYITSFLSFLQDLVTEWLKLALSILTVLSLPMLIYLCYNIATSGFGVL